MNWRGFPALLVDTRCRYTPRQIALLPGDAQHLVVVEADHNEFNQAEGEVRGAIVLLPVLRSLISR